MLPLPSKYVVARTLANTGLLTVLNVMDWYGLALALLVIIMLLPLLIVTWSSPVATSCSLPATSQYLNVEFMPTKTLPPPRLVIAKPESSSNSKVLTATLGLTLPLAK